MKKIIEHRENIFDKTVPGKEFHIYEGPVIYNLRGLLDFLPEMSQRQFKFHVNRSKNDFLSWMTHVYGKGSVTELVRRARTKNNLYKLLKAKCEEYDGRIKDSIQQISEGKGEAAKSALSQHIEQTFDLQKDDFTIRNDKMGDKFDAIAQRMTESLKDPLPEELVKLSEDLTTRYDEIKVRTSELRKLGKDVLIPALYLRQFKPKLGIANASRERSDYEHVKILLDQITAELDEIERKEEIDVKKEVMEMAGLDKEQLKTDT